MTVGDARSVELQPWELLPATDLRRGSGGSTSRAFRQLGCRTYRDAAEFVCRLPYGRPRDLVDATAVLTEGRGTCTDKHALLARLAAELGLPVALTVGIFELDDATAPGVGTLIERHGLDYLPEAHCFLVHAGYRVDVTFAPSTDGAGGIRVGGFVRERGLDPDVVRVRTRKNRWHRAYLGRWLRTRTDVSIGIEELWEIRESCVARLFDRH